MSVAMTEERIREIVRDELNALFVARRSPVTSPSDPKAAVTRFLELMAPGERVVAKALWERWQTWVRIESPEFATLSQAAFGRHAVRTGRVRRSVWSGSRYYIRTSIGP